MGQKVGNRSTCIVIDPAVWYKPAMSIRTVFGGVDEGKIRAVIGHAPSELISSIAEELEDELEDAEEDEEEDYEEGEDLGAAWKAIRAQLIGEASAQRPANEGYVGYVAAEKLVTHVHEEPFWTDFEVKSGFWYDLQDNGGDAASGISDLLDALAEGRGLFGDTIQCECFYALFTVEETKRLREGLARIAEQTSDEEFKNILTSENDGAVPCLDQILNAGLTLYMSAS